MVNHKKHTYYNSVVALAIMISEHSFLSFSELLQKYEIYDFTS